MGYRYRYFLSLEFGSIKVEQEVSQAEYVTAERMAGFRPNGRDVGQPATAGFSSGGISGRVEYVSEEGESDAVASA